MQAYYGPYIAILYICMYAIDVVIHNVQTKAMHESSIIVGVSRLSIIKVHMHVQHV